MQSQETGKDVVSLAPTKAFFVHMLTKDIELEDAILDLLDNCVDGALRSAKTPLDLERPYAGYYAELAFSGTGFSIKDNCGGISNAVRDSAFRLGRPPGDKTDENLPTVGTYGIGMKRAVFKVGFDCLIQSHTANSGFSVHISREWMAQEDTWEIPVEDFASKEPAGTTITVTDLRAGVAAAFDGPASFRDTFKSRVSQYYSVLIDKGFEVRIDTIPIPAMPLSLRSADFEAVAEAKGIAPYIYESDSDGVQVEVMVGFFAPFESDPDEDPTAGRAEEAGWTIVCNDRVIVYKDKSILTGWGDGAPNYHPQFRQISGLVTFTSAEPAKLPITTTKRGINAQNPVFLEVRKRMRDGLTVFTSFTNSLKKLDVKDRDNLFRSASPVEVKVLRVQAAKIKPDSWAKERGGTGRIYYPPLPKVAESNNRKMVFSRPIDQIRKVARFLLGEPDTLPSETAAAAFDHVLGLSKAKK
jgi:hypothetical protein